jgi:hypothetical protein
VPNGFRIMRWILVMLGALLLQGPFSLLHAVSIDLRVTPDPIQIGSFFSGAKLMVSAEVPKGAEVVIKVIGKVSEQELMRKGKRWDLWMNVGEVDVENAPGMYLAASSNPKSLLPPAADSSWGYEALAEKVSFKGRVKAVTSSELFREFVRLKEGQGLYGVYPGEVKLSPAGDDHDLAETSFWLPTRIAPGTYQVCLTAVGKGQTVQQQCLPLEVAMVGFPAFLSSLARDSEVLYGFFAVALAMATGLLTGVIFKKKRSLAEPPGGH